jgi:15-cis-phytoene synthase / lycopene beta-cyclase
MSQIAVVSTTPWDSYLIRNRIWTYPANVVVGLRLFEIPVEEVFFFVVQTYNTSLLYLLLSKPTFHPVYLRATSDSRPTERDEAKRLRLYSWYGQLVLGISLGLAHYALQTGGRGTYLSLIVAWAGPFLLLLWSLAYQFLLGLPWTNTALPIALPTLYLWIVDTLALRRGTWVIEPGTKLGWQLWPGLEIEEAFFFLVTNALIVFGLVAFDNALAVLYTFTPIEREIPALPSPVLLVRALLKPTSKYDAERLIGLREAVARLRAKSRSFFLASGAFEGRLRIDLIIL